MYPDGRIEFKMLMIKTMIADEKKHLFKTDEDVPVPSFTLYKGGYSLFRALVPKLFNKQSTAPVYRCKDVSLWKCV
jgi:hypothetical protein